MPTPHSVRSAKRGQESFRVTSASSQACQWLPERASPTGKANALPVPPDWRFRRESGLRGPFAVLSRPSTSENTMPDLHLLSPRGFVASGIYAGIKTRQTPDVGLLI